MKKTFICLAKSVREGGLCVAGKEIDESDKILSWFRPVVEQTNAIPAENCNFEIGNIISCDVTNPSPISTQKENFTLADNPNWTLEKKSYKINYDDLLDNPNQLWENLNSTYGINDKSHPTSSDVTGNSLYFIKVDNATIKKINQNFDDDTVIKPRLRLIFNYNGIAYSLVVTDPSLSSLYWNTLQIGDSKEIGACYLTISLGKEFSKTGYCYKLVAGYVKK